MSDVSAGAALTGRGLSQSFGERSVLGGVDLELRRGELLAVTGVSGSGKSTLLYALAGLRQPQAGTVAWGDHADVWRLGEPDITLIRRTTCGFVFQFPAFLDDLTVAANVAIPLVVAGTKPRHAHEQACELLDRFGLSPLTESYPSTLSSGELQRASIARALTMKPSIVFCDEPTGALDESNSETVVGELRGIAEAFGVGVLIVTHDPSVSAASDRVLRLDRGRLIDERTAA
jgi:putative ABC transport system ATP-binding protein